MNRVTAQEMRGFTMHDSGHGLKVAHLMWYILSPARRSILTPVEIALLVVAAHLHDLGMGLSDEERRARLSPDSDLWEKLDPNSAVSEALSALSALINERHPSDAKVIEATYQVQQAQEALLCADSRERHATKERYSELLSTFSEMHFRDPRNIPDPATVLSFDGDSFQEKLIEICVSHEHL
jgi:hypothetical protein